MHYKEIKFVNNTKNISVTKSQTLQLDAYFPAVWFWNRDRINCNLTFDVIIKIPGNHQIFRENS